MSVQWRILRNVETHEIVLARVKLCESFWCHFRGLQLVLYLPADEGLLFVTEREGRAHTTIHMLFMLFDIAVIWLDAGGRVVDKRLAKPWRLAYAPQAPAQYFLEATPDLLEKVQIGDVLRFDEACT